MGPGLMGIPIHASKANPSKHFVCIFFSSAIKNKPHEGAMIDVWLFLGLLA
jgi:hypothetical protein